ncbi:hypothetical protein PR202_ga09642 [Eleusine coracana subsp. coracana]|uniref:F-box domain-containing protein n=1 Tax=Eleusine coracana subsp. coracana TaxID=191504 RepID=A0AAV5C581_ELECO|nr:hypothetical protein PR202_ga09642 [Eleusine coracana subsp. coracana]
MARAPSGKRPRKRRRRRRAAAGAVAVGPDCFTHLNDDLLRTIVQRLPVRSAASLSGASRHFRAQVPTLLDRVDSLLLHEPHFPTPLPDARPLMLRRLAIAPHPAIPPATFSPILRTAAGHGIAELSIRLARRARLPKNVFFIRSLAVLSLNTCAVPLWSKVACPCLRTLKLHRVAIHQDTLNRVLASASCLETLEMIYCTGLSTGTSGGRTLESSSMKNLVFRPPLRQAEVTITAPGLRTVILYTRAKVRRLELMPAPEIRKAYLNISKPRRPIESFRVRSFLDAATMLNCLTLRGQAMKLLSFAYKDTPKLDVVFQNLRILSDVNTDEDKSAKTIKDKPAEIDEDMVAEPDEDMVAEPDNDIVAETDDVSTETDEYDAAPFFTDHKERLTKIPCLTTCLVEFKFLGFKPEEYEKSLVVFLLTQAKNLKKLGVQFEKSQEAVVKEILSVRKAPIQRTFNKYGALYVELDYS